MLIWRVSKLIIFYLDWTLGVLASVFPREDVLSWELTFLEVCFMCFDLFYYLSAFPMEDVLVPVVSSLLKYLLLLFWGLRSLISTHQESTRGLVRKSATRRLSKSEASGLLVIIQSLGFISGCKFLEFVFWIIFIVISWVWMLLSGFSIWYVQRVFIFVNKTFCVICD